MVNIATFVESVPGNYYQHIIRSTKCSMFVKSASCYTAYSQTNHYMRMPKSRSQKIDQTSKHARVDYMTKDKLLKHSRQMADKIDMMQVKIHLKSL